MVALFTQQSPVCLGGAIGLALSPDNLLDRMLDPAVRLATSTPGADPGGDYAWAVFARADDGASGRARNPGGQGAKVGGRVPTRRCLCQAMARCRGCSWPIART